MDPRASRLEFDEAQRAAALSRTRYEVYEAGGHVLIAVDPRPGGRPLELDGKPLRLCLVSEGDLAGVERFVLEERLRLDLRRSLTARADRLA